MLANGARSIAPPEASMIRAEQCSAREGLATNSTSVPDTVKCRANNAGHDSDSDAPSPMEYE